MYRTACLQHIFRYVIYFFFFNSEQASPRIRKVRNSSALYREKEVEAGTDRVDYQWL